MIDEPSGLFFKQTTVGVNVYSLLKFHCSIAGLTQSRRVIEESSSECLNNVNMCNCAICASYSLILNVTNYDISSI